MKRFHKAKFATREERAAAARLPAVERQWMVDNLLFEYPLFKKVTSDLSAFHRPVKGGSHGCRMVGGVLGESRSGKSFICKHYAAGFPPRDGARGEVHPVLYLEARSDWTAQHMAEQLFLATGAKSIPSDKTSAMITKSCKRIVNAETELVIIDDAHFLLMEAKGQALGRFKSFIKAIADLETCNIVLSGLPRLYNAVEGENQLHGRGGFPHWDVKALDWNLQEEKEQFALLLDGIDRRLPFRSSSSLAAHVVDFHHATDGMIGRVMNIVKDAAYRAINDDTACILDVHLWEAQKPRRKPGDSYVYFLNRGREAS